MTVSTRTVVSWGGNAKRKGGYIKVSLTPGRKGTFFGDEMLT